MNQFHHFVSRQHPAATATILTTLLCHNFCVCVDGGDLPQSHAPMTFAVDANADEFLGEPLFIQPQKLWESRGGWGGTVTAHDGTIIVFRSPGGGEIRRSHDGGQTWEASEVIDPSGDPRKANIANALVDETTGDLLYICPQEKWLYRSVDSGETWAKEPITVKPDRLGLRPGHEGAGAMQAGITLGFGPHRGRLISPARIMGPQNSNDVHWRPYHYSTAIFSDDHGKSWQTSEPFPVLGTGEAAIAQLATGVLLLNSREHMSRGNRFIARSDDGGQLWVAPCRSADLPDGPRGSSYGLMGGMLRLPIAGRDILLFSNADTDLGAMPAQPGASISGGREKLTIWASFDGGQTWPTKRLLYDGPSAYSNLGVGRHGTPSAGRIVVVFEGGPQGSHEAVQVATFNLGWLLNNAALPANKPSAP